MRSLMIDVERYVQWQQRFQLIRNIRVEIPDFLAVLASVGNQGNRRGCVVQIYFFKDEAGQEIIQLLFAVRLTQIVI